MKLPWKRLIRFESTDGRVLRGEPVLPSEDFDLGKVTESDKLKAKIITGDDIFDTTGKTKVTDEEATVKKLLGPLVREEVPVLRCIGLNYAKHSKSTSRSHDLRLPSCRSQSPRKQDSWFVDVNVKFAQSRKPGAKLHQLQSSSSSQTLVSTTMMPQW